MTEANVTLGTHAPVVKLWTKSGTWRGLETKARQAARIGHADDCTKPTDWRDFVTGEEATC